MSEQPERREFDRRRGQRRATPPQPWWRANWKGVVGILAGVATLLTPVFDYLHRSAAMEYKFRLDLRKVEIETVQKRDKEVKP